MGLKSGRGKVRNGVVCGWSDFGKIVAIPVGPLVERGSCPECPIWGGKKSLPFRAQWWLREQLICQRSY